MMRLPDFHRPELAGNNQSSAQLFCNDANQLAEISLPTQKQQAPMSGPQRDGIYVQRLATDQKKPQQPAPAPPAQQTQQQQQQSVPVPVTVQQPAAVQQAASQAQVPVQAHVQQQPQPQRHQVIEVEPEQTIVPIGHRSYGHCVDFGDCPSASDETDDCSCSNPDSLIDCPSDTVRSEPLIGVRPLHRQQQHQQRHHHLQQHHHDQMPTPSQQQHQHHRQPHQISDPVSHQHHQQAFPARSRQHQNCVSAPPLAPLLRQSTYTASPETITDSSIGGVRSHQTAFHPTAFELEVDPANELDEEDLDSSSHSAVWRQHSQQQYHQISYCNSLNRSRHLQQPPHHHHQQQEPQQLQHKIDRAARNLKFRQTVDFRPISGSGSGPFQGQSRARYNAFEFRDDQDPKVDSRHGGFCQPFPALPGPGSSAQHLRHQQQYRQPRYQQERQLSADAIAVSTTGRRLLNKVNGDHAMTRTMEMDKSDQQHAAKRVACSTTSLNRQRQLQINSTNEASGNEAQNQSRQYSQQQYQQHQQHQQNPQQQQRQTQHQLPQQQTSTTGTNLASSHFQNLSFVPGTNSTAINLSSNLLDSIRSQATTGCDSTPNFPPPPVLPIITSHRTNSAWMRVSSIILTPIGIVIILFIVVSPLLHYVL